MPTGGWLGKEVSKKPEEAQQLSFSFQAQSQDKGSPSPSQSPWQILASTGQVADEATMLRQALAGLDRQGGLYLTPVLYRPTVQVWYNALLSDYVVVHWALRCICAYDGSMQDCTSTMASQSYKS